MNKILFLTSMIFNLSATRCEPIMKTENKKIKQTHVFKKVLKNGMTVLVRPSHVIPKVSVQIWYNVGSKDEKTGEKGIAHLIEHMIFKGTDKNLSESDINVLAQKLSGSINAFTSYDYTGYKFDLPEHNWEEILPVIAETMEHARFDDEHLASEMKAVIQELKMIKDSHVRSLIYDMLTVIFPDHPYHYPIVGYKQDLWNVNGQDLKRFYKKHYFPNNATLIVVGDVNREHVFKLAEKYFGKLKPNNQYLKEVFYHNKDIAAKSVSIYRDIKQPTVVLSFVVPGSTQKQDQILDVIDKILGGGKSSVLYHLLVDKEKLVTSLSTFTWSLFDHGLFFIIYEPNKIEDVNKINDFILHEIEKLAKEGPSKTKLAKAIKQSRMHYYHLMENTQSQAYEIGKAYLATGDENYAFDYLDESTKEVEDDIKKLLSEYLRRSVMHQGFVLPLPEKEKYQWLELQKKSDELDTRILSARQRKSAVEEPRYANKIEPKIPNKFDFPKPDVKQLKNGLKLFWLDSSNTPKIDLVLELKAKHLHDPKDLAGIANFISDLLTEGTKNYTAKQFAEEIESRAMSLSVYPGGIAMSMLKEDFEKGLELLLELLTNAIFDKDEIAKVKMQLLAQIKNYWDDPKSFSSHLIKQEIYKDHQYAKNILGTAESIEKITRADMINFYNNFISPDGAKLVIVGDLSGYDVPKIVEKIIGKWTGPKVPDITYPQLEKTKQKEINYPINRDQVVLSMAALSVDRKHPDFDKLQLFDQILGGGALGSLASRLFQLREQTGLFYSIAGSTVVAANKQPGMVLVKTIVSLDRAKEAEDAIKKMLKTVADDITHEEFKQAKNAIINAIINNFESNKNTALAFLILDRFGFGWDYFDKKAQMLDKLTIKEVQEAVKKVLDPDKMVTLRVGRVPKT